MRIADRIELIRRAADDLALRYAWDEIEIFLAACEVETPHAMEFNKPVDFAKAALGSASEAALLRVAAELDLVTQGVPTFDQTPPRNWQETNSFRLFLSHISGHKREATRLRDCLLPYGILGFVAHEDIKPTEEWQDEIERALRTMDGFVAIHTEGFSDSSWTQQEIGFALGRGVKIISFKLDDADPTGFLSSQQALARQNRTAEEIAEQIDGLLANDSRTSTKLSDAKATITEPDDDDVPF